MCGRNTENQCCTFVTGPISSWGDVAGIGPQHRRFQRFSSMHKHIEFNPEHLNSEVLVHGFKYRLHTKYRSVKPHREISSHICRNRGISPSFALPGCSMMNACPNDARRRASRTTLVAMCFMRQVMPPC